MHFRYVLLPFHPPSHVPFLTPSLLSSRQTSPGHRSSSHLPARTLPVFAVVGNAINFTETGSVTVRLSEVSAAPSSMQRTLRLEVIDTGLSSPQPLHPLLSLILLAPIGCGIDKAFLRDNLFNIVRQDDALSASAGLGLSLQHNSSVE
jgi:hypothetical protein